VIPVGQTRAVPEIASTGRMTKPLRVSDHTVSGDAVALIELIFRDERDGRFGPPVRVDGDAAEHHLDFLRWLLKPPRQDDGALDSQPGIACKQN
jgi:hypothetical protein